MSHWQRGLVLVAGLLCALAFALAQAATEQQEKEADTLFMQGEGRMKVMSYEEALTEFQNVLKRYPNTQVRYKAQFRMSDAFVALKREPDALKILQTVAKEESPDWSPQALMKIGDVYASQQKYTEAFRSYKQIATDYPDSQMVDHAYFAIGSLHFRLGHFELAAEELDKVGTAFASRTPDLQRVSPGEPLYIRLTEPNLVANDQTKLSITVSAKSGDKETAILLPEVEGGDRFSAPVPTKLGDAKPGNGVLELHGNDTVTLAYKSRYVADGAAEKTVTMAIAANARLAVRDSTGIEVRGVVVSDTMTIEVNDPDRDVTDAPDTITVEVKTKKKDTEKLTLKETGAHTGIFQAPLNTVKIDDKDTPKPNSGAIETNAQLAENSSTQYDDNVTITYVDEVSLTVQPEGMQRKISSTIILYAVDDGILKSVEPKTNDATKEITAKLYQGRSLTEIAATYRDLGQEGKAAITFNKAKEKFQEIIAKFPNAPEVEDAMYALFEVYVSQEQYDSAINMVAQITRRFPTSPRASQALFELASLHVRREEYDRALGIYQSLLQRTKGTQLAEEAQFCICTTYVVMLKPRADRPAPAISRDMATNALLEFATTYPNSERTPDVLFQLVDFRFKGEDYKGVVDGGRRMEALFPDNVLTGRVLLLQAQAQYKLKDIDGALETLAKLIANYGDVAAQAEALMTQIAKKKPTASATSTTTGKDN